MPRNRQVLNYRQIGVIYKFFPFLLRFTADRVKNNINVSGISDEHNSSPLNDEINGAESWKKRKIKFYEKTNRQLLFPFISLTQPRDEMQWASQIWRATYSIQWQFYENLHSSKSKYKLSCSEVDIKKMEN